VRSPSPERPCADASSRLARAHPQPRRFVVLLEIDTESPPSRRKIVIRADDSGRFAVRACGNRRLSTLEEDEMSDRLNRWAPLTGVAFAVLMVAGSAVGPTTPKPSSSGAQVIAFFTAHRTGERAGAALGTLALALLLFFAASLYARIRHANGGDALGAVALVGAGLLAAGMTVSGSLTWALTDGPSSFSPSAAHALNAVGYDMILPMIAGILVFAIATGIAVVRGGSLPRWLGWLLIVFGLIAPTPAFPVALYGIVAWTGVVAVLLVARSHSANANTVDEPRPVPAQ
jgi:hypothetical protein